MNNVQYAKQSTFGAIGSFQLSNHTREHLHDKALLQDATASTDAAR
jgi:hypothetical protein